MPNMPTMPSLDRFHPGGGKGGKRSMKGTWEKISVPPLPRSSHSVDIVAGTVYVFGGEVEPRKPVDNDMHAITLPSSGAQADYYAIKAKAPKKKQQRPATVVPTVVLPDAVVEEVNLNENDDITAKAADTKGKGVATGPDHLDLGDVPAPRIGHATAVIGHRIFLFGGRGGPDMKTALDESGRVWVFDTRTHLWSYLDPVSTTTTTSPVPEPRSYHAAVATDKPRDFNQASAHQRQRKQHKETWRDWARGDSDAVGIPQRPIVGSVAEHATDADSDGYGTLIIHGGCIADGKRAADVWAFDIHSRTWQRLPDAPGSARGGAALALSRSRLYRYGGFDGERAEGGQLDYLELAVDSFDDEFSAGEVAISARGGGWQSLIRGKENVGYKEVDAAETPLAAAENGEDGDWPGNRSVASLEAVAVGGGREYLVLALGERDPSGAGHAAAGTFWDDVWAFQVPAQGMSLASVADTVFSVAGRKSGEGKWTKVEMGPHDDEDDGSLDGPGARGWVASGTMGDLEENGIVIWGGLNANNQRLGDGWILRLS
ncbi:hypothetical protein B0T17DRAFT_497153 [Bombardia bombarda]|uniref:Uncharacterized protein n=1 Tax=Bombardia bombarda TaxID=252184 RepID=A0AA39WI86_9PEZI|nr:hypothetical protein B0T17DRAFT_497153 [Bombardia bombarda]